MQSLFYFIGIFKGIELVIFLFLKWLLLFNMCKYEVLQLNIYEVYLLCWFLGFVVCYFIISGIDNDKFVEIYVGFFFDVDVFNVIIDVFIDYGIFVYVYFWIFGLVFDYLLNDGFF